MTNRNTQSNLRWTALLAALLWVACTWIAQANDTDVVFTTNDGSSKFSIKNTYGVEIASVTSNGNAYFRSIVSTTSAVTYALGTDATTTLASLSSTGLTFTLAAFENWSFEFNLQLNAPIGGTKFGIDGPGFNTMRTVIAGTNTTAANFNAEVITTTNTASTNTYGAAGAGFANCWYRITGVMQTDKNPGTLTLQYESVTPGNSTVLKAGSYLTARKMVN